MLKHILMSTACFSMASEGGVSAQDDQSHAKAMADKGGSAINDLILSLTVKAQEVKAGPVTVLAALRKVYGDDNLLVEFPRLGTKYDKDKPSNQYTEHYDVQVTGEDGTKTKRGNFFTDYWNNTSAGKAQVYVLSQCKLALGKTPEKAEKAYQDMPREDLQNLETQTKNANSLGRGYIRKAIGAWEVMVDLGECLAKVDTGLVKKGNPLVSLTLAHDWRANPVPYNLIDNTRLRMYRPISVADVLKLDVAEAVAKGGHLYDALKAQLDRGVGDGVKAGVPAISSADKAHDYMLALINYLENDENVDALKKLMGQKKGGELIIRAVGTLRTTLAEVWSPAMQTRYSRLIDADIETGGDQPAEGEQAAA